MSTTATMVEKQESVLAPTGGGLKPGQRWTVTRKREVVLRMLRGEAVERLSRELGVEVYRLEQWRDKALAGIDASLKERDGDPLAVELDGAMRRIGELTMARELLEKKIDSLEGNRPLAMRRSRR